MWGLFLGMWGPYNLQIVYTLALPESLAPGDYVLGWRWTLQSSSSLSSSWTSSTLSSWWSSDGIARSPLRSGRAAPMSKSSQKYKFERRHWNLWFLFGLDVNSLPAIERNKTLSNLAWCYRLLLFWSDGSVGRAVDNGSRRWLLYFRNALRRESASCLHLRDAAAGWRRSFFKTHQKMPMFEAEATEDWRNSWESFQKQNQPSSRDRSERGQETKWANGCEWKFCERNGFSPPIDGFPPSIETGF